MAVQVVVFAEFYAIPNISGSFVHLFDERPAKAVLLYLLPEVK